MPHHSEQIGWVCRSQPSRGKGARQRTGDDCSDEHHDGHAGGHDQRQVGGRGHASQQHTRHRKAGDEAENTKDQSLFENDTEKKQLGITHGLEGGILAQVIGDIGRQHLIDDDDAHKNADDNAKAEDDAGWALGLLIA